MHVVITNGNPGDVNLPFEEYVSALASALELRGHAANLFRLRDLDIRDCVGCFDC